VAGMRLPGSAFKAQVAQRLEQGKLMAAGPFLDDAGGGMKAPR
jgi:uncharacterized protein YciI